MKPPNPSFFYEVSPSLSLNHFRGQVIFPRILKKAVFPFDLIESNNSLWNLEEFGLGSEANRVEVTALSSGNGVTDC